MDRISYNFKRHIYLVNYKKNFPDKFSYKKSPAEYLELLRYGVAVELHIIWENRFKIASLIQTYLKKEINSLEFHRGVFGFRKTYINQCKNFEERLFSGEIKEFFPNKESYKLEGFVSNLYFDCEFLIYWDEDCDENWDEEEFYNSIRNRFLKLQEILNEE